MNHFGVTSLNLHHHIIPEKPQHAAAVSFHNTLPNDSRRTSAGAPLDLILLPKTYSGITSRQMAVPFCAMCRRSERAATFFCAGLLVEHVFCFVLTTFQ